MNPPDFEGDEYSAYKSRLWRYVIPIEYVDTEDQEVIDSIFDRLNRNGEPLTGQELRNANYYDSPFINIIRKLSNIHFWSERLKVVDRSRMEEIEFLSELAFLVIIGEEVQSNQKELDDLYEKYANNSEIDYNDIYNKLLEITNYMKELDLDYENRKISGVSHLYGLFSFCKYCVDNSIDLSIVKDRLNEFYDLRDSKDYSRQELDQYKMSMSARTKDSGQRKKRKEALQIFCLSTK